MRVLRWMTIAIAGLVALVVLLVASVLLLSDRSAVRAAIRPRLETLLSEALRLDVRIDDVAGLSPWQGVRATGVSLSRDGARMIAADVLHVRLGLVRLLPPLVSIRAEGDGVAVDLSRAPDGEWNLVRAFASENAEKSPPPAWLDAIDLVLHGGALRVRGLVEQPLDLSAIDGEAVLVLGDSGRLTVRQLTARLGGASQLAASGWLDLGAPSALEVQVDARSLAGADLKPIVPQLADAAALTGTAQVTGSLDAPGSAPASPTAKGEPAGRLDLTGAPASPTAKGEPAGRLDLTGALHLASGAATIDLWAQLGDASAGRHVTASWQTLALDPAQLVAGAPPASISGAGNVDTLLGAGWPSALAADARLWSTSVAGAAVDWMTVQARREGERILLDAQLAAPNGGASAELASWIGVGEPHAAGGELRFALVHPEQLPDPVPAVLADSDLRGRLTATADRVESDDRVVRAELQLERGRLRGVPLERASARGVLEAGVASLDELRVEGGANRILAWGWTQLAGTPEQRSLRAGVVGPVDLGVLPGARGKAVARGSLWGTVAAIDAEASLRSDGPVLLPGATGTFSISAQARDVASARPSADVVAAAKLAPTAALAAAIGPQARDLDVELKWRRPAPGEPTLLASASVRPPDGGPDQLSIDVAASEPDRRQHALRGLVERRGETVVARLDELRVAPPRGPAWTLAHRALVSYAPDSIAVQQLELGSGAGRVSLDGALVRDGRNDLSLTVADLDLKGACATVGLARSCGGDLDASLRLAGPSRAPDLSGSVRVRELALSGQTYGGAELTLATEGRLVVRGDVGREPFGPLALVARLPLAGGWPVPTIDANGALDATLTGDDVRLAAFQAFAGPAISELQGQADLRLAASGTLAAPQLAGGVVATGVGLGIVATGAKWQDGSVRLSFAGQSVRLDELSFHDGHGGALSGGGALALAGDDDGPELVIDLRGLDVVARRDVDAKASGTVRIGGSVATPRVLGDVRIDSATIRPALLPGGAGPPPDPSIRIIRAGDPPPDAPERAIGDALAGVPGTEPAPPATVQAASAPEPALLDHVRVLVTVRLGDPVVVQRIDAYVRLGGEVYLTKGAGDPLRITGQISAGRGWYMFRGRRILLQSAYVSFSGEAPIDPYLTIIATYQAPEHLVTVRVEGTAGAPQLELSSDPPLDQSDVLAVLLFGRTTSQLTGGQGTELRQEAIGILASYVAPELEQSLMDTFGLASLTFQLPTGTSYGSVGVGRYFGDDIFVSIGQTFGGPQGGTTRQLGGLVGSSLTVQYYLTPSVTLQTSSSTEGESALDAVWHTRY